MIRVEVRLQRESHWDGMSYPDTCGPGILQGQGAASPGVWPGVFPLSGFLWPHISSLWPHGSTWIQLEKHFCTLILTAQLQPPSPVLVSSHSAHLDCHPKAWEFPAPLPTKPVRPRSELSLENLTAHPSFWVCSSPASGQLPWLPSPF